MKEAGKDQWTWSWKVYLTARWLSLLVPGSDVFGLSFLGCDGVSPGLQGPCGYQHRLLEFEILASTVCCVPSAGHQTSECQLPQQQQLEDSFPSFPFRGDEIICKEHMRSPWLPGKRSMRVSCCFPPKTLVCREDRLDMKIIKG